MSDVHWTPFETPLSTHLSREYAFSTQADTAEAMAIGAELFAAGERQGVEKAAQIAEDDDNAHRSPAIAAAIRRKISGEPK